MRRFSLLSVPLAWSVGLGACADAPADDTATTCTPAWAGTDLALDALQDVLWDDVAGVGWGVSANGRVVAIDGDAWSEVTAGADATFTWRSALAPDGSIWSLGPQAIAHWDGAWTEVPFSADGAALDHLDDLVVRADGTVVIVGSWGCGDCYEPPFVYTTRLLAWDGAAWTTTELTLEDRYGTALAEGADGRLVVVGTDGLVLVEDGAGFDTIASGTTGFLEAVAVDGDGIVAVGRDGTVVRGPLDALTVETLGAADLSRVDVADGVPWVLGGDGVWVDAGGWRQVAVPIGPRAVAAVGADDVLLVGEDGAGVGLRGGTAGFAEVYRRDGVNGLGDVWVDSDGAAWVVDASGRLLRWDTTIEGVGQADGWSLDRVAGASAQDIVASGGEVVAEWDGATVRSRTVDDAVLLDTTVAPDGTAWVVGLAFAPDSEETSAFAEERVAGAWEEVQVDLLGARNLVAAYAPDADHLFVLAQVGTTYGLAAWDAAGWTWLAEDLGGAYAGMEGRAADDLYVFGEGDGGAGLLHWDGAALVPVEGVDGRVIGVGLLDDTLVVATFDRDAGATAWVVDAEGGVGAPLGVDDLVRVAAGGGEAVVVSERGGWRWAACD